MKTLFVFSISLLLFFPGCKKNEVGQSGLPANYVLSYGESVFYLKADEYVVRPKFAVAGTYQAMPDDLNIDNASGNITVSVKGKSGKATQTGLRYRIIFTSIEGKKDTTFITLAGINYQDKIYSLSANETLVTPVYNATPSMAVPGGVYTSSNNKVAINANNGQIDLKKTIQNGFFNDDPQNSDWRVVNIRYSVNDGSASEKNNLDLVIYYYTSVTHIPSNVSGAMKAHQTLLLGLNKVTIPDTFAAEDNDIKGIVSSSKPRPPCIIIIN